MLPILPLYVLKAFLYCDLNSCIVLNVLNIQKHSDEYKHVFN